MNISECSTESKNTTFQRCGNEVCKKNYSTLLKCSGCRTKSYCSVDCQKTDWYQHKKICRLETTSKDIKKNESKLEGVKTSVLDSAMLERPMPISGLRLIENFISDDLHERFIEQMNRGIPEINNGHYDGYTFKNFEDFDKVFYTLTKDVFLKLKVLNFFSSEKRPLKLACTLLGYDKNGFITRHVDSPLLSGGTVILISFNSPVVVNFYSQKKTEEQQHKIFIPPKSIYAISGEARYEWSHAILKDENTYNSKEFARGRRYVIVYTPPGSLDRGSVLLNF
ncbi:MAG: zinc finger MYND domain-containing protein [Parachlamydiaceae bacterium]|nr:zinc finger MYND domain-containing protein [Parachlamydiaceae bacterium]